MSRLLHWFSPVILLILVQCSSPYEPDCGKYGAHAVPPEEQLVQEAENAWNVLKNKKHAAHWEQAKIQYNQAIYTLVEKLRCDEAAGKKVDSVEHPFVIDHSYSRRFENSRLYDQVIPANLVKLSKLEECYTVDGLGVPLIGVINRSKAAKLQNQISDAEGVQTLTAVLDFSRLNKGKPTLKLIPRLQENHIKIGRQYHDLAANFSAAIDFLWEKSKVDDSKILGLFRPSENFDIMGLFFHEPYDPDKIPVIFTHGLQSSPATFANLTNRLLASPEIRKNYQFWYFGYPTGISWVLVSSKFRDAIEETRKKFDPGKKHKSFDQMVLIGHSMGGLITRYSMSEDAWKILKHTLKESEQEKLGPHYLRDLSQKTGNTDVYEKYGKAFEFSPLPYPKRVVLLATPHRGSDFASNWIGRLGIALIKLPQNLLEETYRIVTFNNNIFILKPEKLVNDLTSISQLSPGNAMIKGLDPLRIDKNISVHSIVGDRGRNDAPNSSDGLVKYSSSHLNWADTETIVPAGHSVQRHHLTASEILSLLNQHLKEHRGKAAFQFKHGTPAPAKWSRENSGTSSESSYDSRTNFIPIID